MIENNTKDKKFKKLIVFVALSYLVIYAKSYADQVQDIPKPNATEQQTNKVILSAKENKSVDNSEEESESEENDESEDKTKEDEEDTEDSDDTSRNKTIKQNNMVAKPIIAPKPAEKIIVCGIELGHTTINELESKYKPVIVCHSSEEYKVPTNWKVYSFDPNDFGTKELPLGSLAVANNEGGVIHSIKIEIPVRMFDDVKQKYTNKQSELLKEEQKDGVTTIEYKLTDKIIKLEKSEKNFFVTYSDNEFKKAIDSMSSMQNMATSSEELKKTDNSDKPNGKKDTIKSESDGIDDLKPLGIVIDSTQEAEIRSKYRIISELTDYGWRRLGSQYKNVKGLKTLFLDTNSFATQPQPVKKIEIVINEKNVVASVSIEYDTREFENISRRISKKYKIIEKKGAVCRYKASKIEIELEKQKDGGLLKYNSKDWVKFNKKIQSIKKNPAPYGIELGWTTENELRFMYEFKDEFYIEPNGKASWIVRSYTPVFRLFGYSADSVIGLPGTRIICLKPENFHHEDLYAEYVSVYIDENKKIPFVSVAYDWGNYKNIKKMLDKKYKTTKIKDWKFYNCKSLYKSSNSIIGLFLDPEPIKVDNSGKTTLRLIADSVVEMFASKGEYRYVAVDYCLEEYFSKFKKWVKEKESRLQQLF